MALSKPSLIFAERHTRLSFDTVMTVKTGQTVYMGAAVGLDVSDGTARPVSADSYPFVGFAMSTATAGQQVIVRRGYGYQVRVPFSGTGADDIGKKVYATADDTFTFTSTGATAIGTMAITDTEDTATTWVLATGDTWT